MNIIKLPTGYLFTGDYDKGKLETLSIGDYGKHRNIKADFLGHTKEIHGVANGEILPLQEKWVVTLSTQYGCAMKCTFCDVAEMPFNGNASFKDLQKQFLYALDMFPSTKYTDRLNVHFARMGEPIFNIHVFDFARDLVNNKELYQTWTGVRVETIHPVLTTMCPTYAKTSDRIKEWTAIKNDLYRGQAGLQLSINSTCDKQRSEMFQGKAMTLQEISNMVRDLPAPLGRKYCLNFAYASGNEVDGEKLASLFNPEHWMVKITPIHNNTSCSKNNIETVGGYESYHPYKHPENAFKSAGFDVLVFVPSKDEEDGLITCGNAILGGSKIKCHVI